MDRDFIDLLQKRKWEENVLELKSYITTFELLPDEVTIRQKDRIELAKINLMIDEGKEFSLKDSLSKTEQWFIDRALEKHEGFQAKAAQSLGITDRSIRRLMKTDSY